MAVRFISWIVGPCSEIISRQNLERGCSVSRNLPEDPPFGGLAAALSLSKIFFSCTLCIQKRVIRKIELGLSEPA